MKNQSVYFIKIAEFVIKVTLGTCDNKKNYKNTITLLEKQYGTFFINKTQHNAEIIIRDRDFIKTVGIHDEYYIHYLKTNGYTFEIFYDTINFHLTFKTIIQQLVNDNDGVFLHASAVSQNNKVILFLGKSNSGKSTTVKLLNRYLTPFADDTVIVRNIKDKYLVFQASFLEKQSIIKQSPEGYELGDCYFIFKCKKVKKIILNSHDSLAKILTHIQFHKKVTPSLFKFLSKLSKKNNCYALQVNLNGKDIYSAITQQVTE